MFRAVYEMTAEFEVELTLDKKPKSAEFDEENIYVVADPGDSDVLKDIKISKYQYFEDGWNVEEGYYSHEKYYLIEAAGKLKFKAELLLEATKQEIEDMDFDGYMFGDDVAYFFVKFRGEFEDGSDEWPEGPNFECRLVKLTEVDE